MAKITDAGLALMAQLQAAGESLVVDKMIYANIDGLDYTQEPPGTEVKPAAGDIVRESAISTAGYVDPNTVVYSDVLSSDIGDFSFNWIGLFSTANNTLIAVTYVPLQYKRATDGFNIGNTLCKNFALNYTDIKDLTGIVIEATIWQQDFSGLYASLDHNHDDRYALINHTHPGKTIVAYGVVKADGTKLSGSDNWTVAQNTTGEYQLNITDAGDYIVNVGLAGTDYTKGANAIHDSTTGIFNNNTASNVLIGDSNNTGFVHKDGNWVFYAIKL